MGALSLFSAFCKKPAPDVYALASCIYRAVAGTAPDAPDRYQDAERLPLPEGRAGCVPIGIERVLLAALGVSQEGYPLVEAFWEAMEDPARG